MAKNEQRPIIIKKVEEVHGGHHGGAWKVAYADFMTAMMAFFLLMWLLNITTDEQKRGIALFFNPLADKASQASPDQSILESSPLSDPSEIKKNKNSDDEPAPKADGKEDHQSKNSHGMQYGGKEEDGVLNSSGMTILPPSSQDVLDPDTSKQPAHSQIIPIGGSRSGLASNKGQIGSGNTDTHNVGTQTFMGTGISDYEKENKNLTNTINDMKKAIDKTPELEKVKQNIGFKIGSDEIRIEMKDSTHTSMFDVGSIAPNKQGTDMINALGQWLASIPEDISIIGATDAQPFSAGRVNGMSNWMLSEARADKVREYLVRQGYPDRKIRSIEGRADHDAVNPEHPDAAENRRVIIVIHRNHSLPQSYKENHDDTQPQQKPKDSVK